jgi:coenzyme F420-reducing hydrogenase delta subunit
MRFIRVIGIFSLVYFLFCITPNEAKAEVDCNATIRAWQIDISLRDYMATHNCSCPSAHAQPVCTKNPVASPPVSGYSGGGQKNMQMQMMQSILQPFFNNLFAIPDNSYQEEQVRQQEEQERQAAEHAKKAALQRWMQMQEQDALEREIKQKARVEDVLSKTKTVGGSGKLEPFSFGNPKLDFKPLSSQTYPAPSTAWEQALCAAYFSNMAKQSTKDVDARFYADQAQSVMSGGPTYLECKIPKVSNEKLAKKVEEVKKVYDKMNVKMKDLQDIEYKISESKEKIEKAELKKEEATAKLDELQNRAATAKPEEKDEMEALIAAAKKEREDAEQESNQAKQSESDYLAKQEQLKNELENMKSQVQNIQAGN